MHRLAYYTAALVMVIAFAGCSSSAATTTTVTSTTDAGSTTTVVQSPVTTAVETAPTAVTPTTVIVDTTATASTAAGPVTEDDLVRFLAATESVLKGTALEGVVYDAPEIYIALAQSACARFTAGDSFDAVAADLVAAVASANAEDDQRLIGAILGAATHTICPEHADLV